MYSLQRRGTLKKMSIIINVVLVALYFMQAPLSPFIFIITKLVKLM